MAILPITGSKHRIISGAMAPVDCQGHMVSRSSGSNSQSCKCLLNAGMSHSILWFHHWWRDWREPYPTWTMRVTSCLCCRCQAWGRVLAVCLHCRYWSRGRVSGGRMSVSQFSHLVNRNFSKGHQIHNKNAALSQHIVWTGIIWTVMVVSYYAEFCVIDMYRNITTLIWLRTQVYILYQTVRGFPNCDDSCLQKCHLLKCSV